MLTHGIDVNALIGREFTIGGVRCRGLRLAETWAHLERLAGPGLLRPLIHSDGLRADVLTNGDIAEGSATSTRPSAAVKLRAEASAGRYTPALSARWLLPQGCWVLTPVPG